MNPRLKTLAVAQHGVFSTADAARVDVWPSALATLVRRGDIVRVRRGVFVLAEVYAAAAPGERYRLAVAAVMRGRPAYDAASHHAALAIHAVALFGVDQRVVDIATRTTRSRVRAGVRTHDLPDTPVERVRGTRAIAVPHALALTAASSGLVPTVCAIDDALHRGLCGAHEIEAAIDALQPRRRALAMRALDRADASSESVGESRTRMLLRDLGLAVVSQVALRDTEGFVGRVDFVVDGLVVVEFDGLVKYAGADGRDALAAEKARESRIAALGYEVVRLTWRDLEDPERVARLIRVARARALGRRAALA